MIVGVRSQKPNRLLDPALPESLLPWEDTKDTKAMSSTHLATFPPQDQMQEGLSPGHSKRKLEKRFDVTVLVPTQTGCYTKEEAPPHVGWGERSPTEVGGGEGELSSVSCWIPSPS